MLIFWLSFGAFQSAIPKFFEPEPSEFHNVNFALAVSVIAVIAYAIPFVDILGRKSKSPALKAQIVACWKWRLLLPLC